MSKLLTHHKIELSVCILTALVAGFVAGRFSLPNARETSIATTSASHLVSQKSAVPERAPKKASPSPATTEGAAKVVEETGGNLSSQAQLDALLQSLLSWGATDPEAALAYASQHLTLERKDQAVTALLAVWVKKDPQGAWNWIEANTPNNRKYLEATVNETGKVDPDAAWRLAAQVAQRKPDRAQTAYLSAVQGMMYAGKFDEAIRLIDNEKSPALKGKDALLTMVAGEWGQYDPHGAMEWAQTLPDKNVREQALSGAMESWSRVDPKSVAEFAVDLPAGDMRQMVMTQAVNTWVDQDPEKVNEVAAWLNQFDGDATYDPMRYKVATTAAAEDVESALSWAKTVTDTELRAQALANILQNWMWKDRAGAQNFLQNSSDLTPQMRAAIQEKLGHDTMPGTP